MSALILRTTVAHVSEPNVKEDFCTLPIYIPTRWRAAFDDLARELCTSRTAVVSLALKIGGPILMVQASRLKQQFRDQLERAAKARRISKILALPPVPPARATTRGNERRKNTRNGSGSNR